MGNRYISVRELSGKTRIKAQTLYKWATEGRLPSRKTPDGRLHVLDMSRTELLHERTCPECGRVFHTMYPRQKFDTRLCESRHTAREWYRKKVGRK